MEALINCGACPDMHREDNLAGVILIRSSQVKGKKFDCPYYFHGDIMIFIKEGEDIEIQVPGKFTAKEIENLGKVLIEHASCLSQG